MYHLNIIKTIDAECVYICECVSAHAPSIQNKLHSMSHLSSKQPANKRLLSMFEDLQWKNCSSAKPCLILCSPVDCCTPGFPVHGYLSKFSQTHVHWVSVPSNHLILCHPLLLLPSIFPSIRIFSNESILHIRYPMYWSFSFSISPSKEYSGLISSRIDWFDLLAVKGLSRVFSSTTIWKHQFFRAQPSLWFSIHIHTWL